MNFENWIENGWMGKPKDSLKWIEYQRTPVGSGGFIPLTHSVSLVDFVRGPKNKPYFEPIPEPDSQEVQMLKEISGRLDKIESRLRELEPAHQDE